MPETGHCLVLGYIVLCKPTSPFETGKSYFPRFPAVETEAYRCRQLCLRPRGGQWCGWNLNVHSLAGKGATAREL